MSDDNSENLEELLDRLRGLAATGPIPAVTDGTKAVGMTLLDALGIEHTSKKKPEFGGIVVTASRRNPGGRTNRVNLFAQVPDWKLSACKSSKEILTRYGYLANDGSRRLYCTVTAKRPNSQRLKLKVTEADTLLEEVFVPDDRHVKVATWKMEKLQDRIIETHPESLWVKAVAYGSSGAEKFHYREAVYTGNPIVTNLPIILGAGTITVDHLIKDDGHRVTEKGPLFKMESENLRALFPAPRMVNLLNP